MTLKYPVAINSERQAIQFSHTLDTYQHLVNYLARFGIQAVVCGGAIRDALLGGPVRDIDLYVAINQFEDAARKLWPTLWPEDTWDRPSPWSHAEHLKKGDGEYDHQSIHGHLELIHEYGLINLIAVDMRVTVDNVIGKFNIALNQIGLGVGGVDFTSECYSDIRNGTATVLRENWGVAGTQNAVRKLRDKYPNLEFKFSDGNAYSDKELEYRATGQASLDLF